MRVSFEAVLAATVTLKDVPAVAFAGATTVKWSNVAAVTTSPLAVLVAVQER